MDTNFYQYYHTYRDANGNPISVVYMDANGNKLTYDYPNRDANGNADSNGDAEQYTLPNIDGDFHANIRTLIDALTYRRTYHATVYDANGNIVGQYTGTDTDRNG